MKMRTRIYIVGSITPTNKEENPVYRERKIIKVDAGYAVVDYKKYRVE